MITVCTAAAMFLAGMTPASSATVTTRVSVDDGGSDANQISEDPSISGTGRYVAFGSAASDLVPNDQNNAVDIFRRDLVTGVTSRVSLDAAGGEANDSSYNPAISASGRYVAFDSWATDLAGPDSNGLFDTFWRDLATGTTVRVSVDASGGDPNSSSSMPAISADGRYVAFESFASDLVSSDGNRKSDIFRRDLLTGTTERVSLDMGGGNANGPSYGATISSNGRYVAFQSAASDLVPGDNNEVTDIFWRDLDRGKTLRVSLDAAGGNSNSHSYDASISTAGRYVAFESGASDIVAGDVNSSFDVFRRDILTGSTVAASINVTGGNPNSDSYDPSLSADGRFIAMRSHASDLIVGDGNMLPDIFRRDLLSGITIRVSVDTTGGDPNGSSYAASISGNAESVAFESYATDLVSDDTNVFRDVFASTI